jgi:hypothetical protein
MEPVSPLQKTLISVFAVANLFTILFMNQPLWLMRDSDTIVNKYFTPMQTYRYRLGEWYVRQYAHFVGLDNQWQMFGRQSRFNWWFEIKAVYAGPKTIDLPLPLQSPRTFWQSTFFDFKEGKYQLNLYPSSILREAYAHYLCRQYPALEGALIQSIIYVLHFQMLLTPEEARRRGTHLEAQSYAQPPEEFKCPPFGS